MSRAGIVPANPPERAPRPVRRVRLRHVCGLAISARLPDHDPTRPCHVSVAEPDAYARFLHGVRGQVARCGWPMRDSRPVTATIAGIRA